ncbi:Alcohol dehydrogenase [Desulfotomaculum nigrificans CO-1-SRB]|uniref:Alcohol dehydrogenase n=1 Tax=Desulfotomaculum nigrificans (strain DSM 14880 / VKM B-2319 / CO-1-SRB) TaxID=868595 RepID=F6B8U1_DESCC|nr:iron-containing alcohol dehydrogenase [Desulfotomaculum nigrificans]AEF94784.1 Alcohol dehydrogenase [Desulfotomaculum nigrificans CO-1-SRB]
MFPTLKEVQYYTPQKIVFGVNAVDKIGQYIKEMGISGKAIIVTDPVLVKTGMVDRVVEALKKDGFAVAVFDQGKPEPDNIVCDEAAEFARKEAGNFVIGLGGGSAIDIAKVAAQLLVLPGKTEDYLVNTSFPKKGAPIIAVPTTSGTGTECTMYSVITFAKDGIKGFFGTPTILPDMALVDPTLTLSMPPKVTASTGADALAHAIETLMAKQENPFTDAISLKAIELIAEALPVAVYEGNNLEARVKMSYASMMAGKAFNDPGIVEGHAIAHTLGSVYHVPHGIGCAVALPHAMEYNMGHCMEKMALMAKALGQKTDGMTVREAAQAAVYGVKQLLEDVGITPSWAPFGKKEDIPMLAEMMTESPWITAFYGWSKRPMTKEAAVELLTRSYEGRLGDRLY